MISCERINVNAPHDEAPWNDHLVRHHHFANDYHLDDRSGCVLHFDEHPLFYRYLAARHLVHRSDDRNLAPFEGSQGEYQTIANVGPQNLFLVSPLNEVPEGPRNADHEKFQIAASQIAASQIAAFRCATLVKYGYPHHPAKA
jgi:hypothetical protein